MEFEQAKAIASDAIVTKIGRPLSEAEIAILSAAWNDQTYEQAADSSGYSLNYLQRDVGPKFWKLLSEAFDRKLSKTNVRGILTQQFGGRGSRGAGEAGGVRGDERAVLSSLSSSPHFDWGEAPDVSQFYGRTTELNTLQQWVLQDHCRLVSILGMGGIGKTALSVKLAQEIVGSEGVKAWGSGGVMNSSPHHPFEFVIWRSLRNAPPIETLLSDLIPFLSNQQETKLGLSQLLNCLRQSRCLIILDNLETVLDARQVGQFRSGFEAYGELVKSVAEARHQSCLVLTSREKPAEIVILEGNESAVRSLRLDGSLEAAQSIIQDKGLIGTAEQKQLLGDRYSNSPLALKIVATSIQELFDCNIGDFLQEETLVFNGIRRLLNQQFSRLSGLEQSIMYWLAINREWTGIAELQTDIVPVVRKDRLLESLESLRFRCLIEQQGSRFTQQPVVMEYVTEQLLTLAEQEIEQQTLHILNTHALFKAEAIDYIRESQRQLILEPLISRLVKQLGNHDAIPPSVNCEAIARHLRQLLCQYQQTIVPSADDYGAGNLLNLLSQLKADLTGADLSGLALRQAGLADTPLHQVNLSNTHLSHTRFAESITDVAGLDVSSEGMLALIGVTGMLFLYDLRTGQWVNSWTAHRGWAFMVIFSANGQTLFTGSHDQRIAQWDVATGQCLHEWRTDSPIWRLALSADGQWLASGHDNRTAQLWHLQTKQQIRVFNHPGAVRGLAFHPQTHHLAIGDSDHTIKLWDCATGECVATFVGHKDPIWDVSFSSTGNCLASASSDGTTKLWNSQTGECLHTLPAVSESSNRTQTNQINRVRFSPDDRLLACACYNSTVQLWEVASGKLFRTLQGHRAGLWALAFSPQGDTLISGGESAQVKIWQVKSGHCMRTLQGKSMAHHTIALDPTGTLLASGSDDAQLRLWSVATGRCLRLYPRHGTKIMTSAFHPEAERIATGGMDGSVNLWDFQGNCLHACKGHENWVFKLVFHPAQSLVVSCGSDAKIYFWCMKTGNLVHTLMLPEGSGHVLSIAFHPQGQIFASGSDDRLVRLWDDTSKTVLRELSGHMAYPWCLTFHPQGELLASGAHDGTVKLWEVSSGNCVATFELSGVPLSVSFSPDGRLLAAGCDRIVYIWDVSTRKCLKQLEGHSNAVSSVAFHPKDSSTLMSASYDETIRFWNIETGECLKVLRPNRIYEGMNIQGVTGLSNGQKAVLKQLGAIEANLSSIARTK